MLEGLFSLSTQAPAISEAAMASPNHLVAGTLALVAAITMTGW
ncbi:hypothetical protein [Thaumasiovibrio subtropicus]|nr:hypothetical protein [Thaumasiovibrio subtropicus]